jgi:hypothetical protein
MALTKWVNPPMLNVSAEELESSWDIARNGDRTRGKHGAAEGAAFFVLEIAGIVQTKRGCGWLGIK